MSSIAALPEREPPVTTHSLRQLAAQGQEALQRGEPLLTAAHPTGFSPLDDVLGGGLRDGELIVLGGPPGSGKTTLALQIARHRALAGGRVLYVSYEHSEQEVLERLITMEAGLLDPDEAPSIATVRRCMSAEGFDGQSPQRDPVAASLGALCSYGEQLVVVPAAPSLDLKALRRLVLSHGEEGEPALLVVDYLQKVRAPGVDDSERCSAVAEALKELAKQAGSPVLALASSGEEGLRHERMRLHHLRSASSLAYEADVVLLLNDKFDIVAKQHLVYGTAHPERFREWVVVSVEKNRRGRALVDLELRKHFSQGRFDPAGQLVAEQLVDERMPGA